MLQVIYGSYVTDNLDQQTLSAVVDYWISPNACKKDFEIPKCMSSPSAALISAFQHTHTNILLHAFQSIVCE